MIRTLPPLIFVLGLLLFPPLLADESDVAAARARIEEARQGLEKVRTAMEERYLEIEADFKLVHSEDWPAVSEGYRTAIGTVDEARRKGESEDPAADLLARFLEQKLLSEPVAGRLAAAAAHALAEAGGEAADPGAVLAGAWKAVFPEEKFSDCWDKAFQDLPVVAEWRKAHDALATAEEALKAAQAEPPGKPAVPPGMVLVPKGRFEFGPWTGWSFDLDRNRGGKKRLSGYFIDVFEVTNARYFEFLKKRKKKDRQKDFVPTGFRAGPNDTWLMPEEIANLPVRGISWSAAAAYADFVGKRLPTEEEWERAARGDDGLLYPWGDEWDPKAAIHDGSGLDRPADVGACEKDVSPYGVHDMAGNVSEFTAMFTGRKPAKTPFESKDQVVFRGGNYNQGKDSCVTTYRWTTPAIGGGKEWIGFRLVLSERDWK